MPFVRIFIAVFLLLAALDANAHGQSTPGNTSGTPIPSLSHGEMAIVAQYRSRILALAGQVKQTDPTFRILLNFSAIQYSYCLWGVAPGAISDEESPFNECAHAYLSAAKALLFHIRSMPGMADKADPLISEIDAEVVRKGAAFIGCQYSGESFNTANFIRPHWENLTRHRPSLYALGAIILLLVSPVLIRLSIAARTRVSGRRMLD